MEIPGELLDIQDSVQGDLQARETLACKLLAEVLPNSGGVVFKVKGPGIPGLLAMVWAGKRKLICMFLQ